MTATMYVRALSPVEQAGVEAGLRSSNAFTLRRSQILLASKAAPLALVGAFKDPLEETRFAGDAERCNVPAIDCVAGGKPGVNPATNHFFASVSGSVGFYDYTGWVERAEDLLSIY
jgi:hypothetical protein